MARVGLGVQYLVSNGSRAVCFGPLGEGPHPLPLTLEVSPIEALPRTQWGAFFALFLSLLALTLTLFLLCGRNLRQRHLRSCHLPR